VSRQGAGKSFGDALLVTCQLCSALPQFCRPGQISCALPHKRGNRQGTVCVGSWSCGLSTAQHVMLLLLCVLPAAAGARRQARPR
jgi:hypothetical protein